MRLINGDHPLRHVSRTGIFAMRPVVLTEYIYSLGLPQIVERVYWHHFDASQGDVDAGMTSTVAISVVAKRVRANASSVTRAYQKLIKLGLIRRIESGREPGNKYRQAISQTQMLVPAELYSLIARCKTRRAKPTGIESTPKSTAQEKAAPAAPTSESSALQALKERHGKNIVGHIFKRLSKAENQRMFDLQRTPQLLLRQSWAADENTKLTSAEIEWVDEFLNRFKQQYLAERCEQPVSKQGRENKRQLSSADLNEIRLYLSKLVPAEELASRMTEFTWDKLHGWMSKQQMPLLKALRFFAKAHREGRWERPTRMPPTWQVTHALPEMCGHA